MKSPRLIAAFILAWVSSTVSMQADAIDAWSGSAFSVNVAFQKMEPSEGYYAPRLTEALVLPDFPHQFITQGLSDETVIADFTVRADGVVADIKIVSALNADVGAAAKKAISKWVFEPARRETEQTKPVSMRLRCRFDFRFQDAPRGPLKADPRPNRYREP